MTFHPLLVAPASKSQCSFMVCFIKHFITAPPPPVFHGPGLALSPGAIPLCSSCSGREKCPPLLQGTRLPGWMRGANNRLALLWGIQQECGAGKDIGWELAKPG